MIQLDLSILNQKGTPMFNSDIFANRPPFGIVGRIFISTNTSQIFRDTGTSYDLIASASAGLTGSGTPGTLPLFSGSTSLGDSLITQSASVLTAAARTVVLNTNTGISALNPAVLTVNTTNTFNGGISWPSLQPCDNVEFLQSNSYNGNITFLNSNYTANNLIVSSFTFLVAATTITSNQTTGIRALSNQTLQATINGTNNGTITHFANSLVYGDFAASTARFNFTNRYGYLVNNLDEYSAGHTYTNRYAFYNQGANDHNYFAGKMLLNTLVVTSHQLSVVGTTNLNGSLTATSASFSVGSDVNAIIAGVFSGTNNPRFFVKANETTNIISVVTSSSTGSDNLLIGVSSGTNLFFKSGGNLGVGTNNPIYLLDVNGTARVSGNSTFVGTANFGNWLIQYGGNSLESSNSNAQIYYNGPIRINGTTPQTNIGSGATGTGISIGAFSNSAANNISIGSGTTATIGASVAIGYNAIASQSRRQLAIGANSSVLHHSCIALNGAVTTAPNQFVAGVMWFPQGNEESPIIDVYFGSGVQRQWYEGYAYIGTNGAGVSYTIHGSGALGTDFAGGNITIAGGKGTGSETSGDVIISTATSTTSGTTLQTLTQRWFVKGSTGILANVASPNASAILQADSTTQGFIPPRMTTTQKNAIASPAAGLIVYDTTLNKLCVFTGAAFQTITSV